jgi:hypothetical protein
MNWGIDGGLSKRDKSERSLTPFINVPSVNDFVMKIEANGGKSFYLGPQYLEWDT